MAPGSIETTLDFASELVAQYPFHEAKAHLYAPYPGTPLYPIAMKHGFVPPDTLEEWSCYDYYEVTTPWVDNKYGLLVRQFNEQHCPYVGRLPQPSTCGSSESRREVK